MAMEGRPLNNKKETEIGLETCLPEAKWCVIAYQTQYLVGTLN